MNKVSFEQIKNIEFPESWIENALDVPSKHRKKPLFILNYRYAIGLAACAVLAVLACLPFMFGAGRDVNISSTKADGQANVAEGTTGYGSADPSAPTDNIPLIFDRENIAGTTAVTEPAESVSADSDPSSTPKQQATSPTAGGAKPQTAGNNKQNNGGGSSQQNNAGSPTEGIEDDDPESPEPATAAPAAQEPTTQPRTYHPYLPAPCDYDFTFYAIVDSDLVTDSVYCRIMDGSGESVNGDGLFSNSQLAYKWNYGNNQAVIEYNSYFYPESNNYTVIFYNSYGNVIKQKTFYLICGGEYSLS